MSAAAEKALRQIMSLSRRADCVTGREIRYFEIALIGTGMPPAQREIELQAVVQKKRDHLSARRIERQGVPDEAS